MSPSGATPDETDVPRPPSDDEAPAIDCAGRDPGDELVRTSGMVDEDGNGSLDDASPGWAPVAIRCEDGDMAACDFTFSNSEPGSEVEVIGSSCGARRVVAVGGSCFDHSGEFADESG